MNEDVRRTNVMQRGFGARTPPIGIEKPYGSVRQQARYACFVAAAYWYFMSILHQGKGLTLKRICSNLFYELQVYNCGSMHADEGIGIQPRFEIGHCFPKQMVFFLRADTYIIFLCTDPANVGNWKK